MTLVTENVSTMGPETAVKVPVVRKPVTSVVPRERHNLLKWNGWGYKDSQFVVDKAARTVSFTGNRYAIGSHVLPHLVDYVQNTFDLDIENFTSISKTLPASENIPQPKRNKDLEKILTDWKILFSTDGIDRLVRSHGHALQDIVHLRELNFVDQPLPDLVLWPDSHSQVEKIVELAKIHNIVLLPFGGGTSVSRAVAMPLNETRLLVVVDTSQMNQLIWLDEENLVANFEAGVVGQDLERVLNSRGYTCGHEPDSYEFSSLGGWVATRASGMKKNIYGNIEDLVVSVRMVTPQGVLHKRSQAPRMSCGPDFNHVILGSEGTLGIITEVAIKIRPMPSVRKYGSIVFPTFESGFACVREVARQRCQPASIRLMDNEQYKFGQALRTESGLFAQFADVLKKLYLSKIKGCDPDRMAVCTLLFEGDAAEVAAQEKRIYEIAKRSGGFSAGETNGKRGYILTFVIAYLRDLAMDFSIYPESFETSVPWDRALPLIRNVKHRIMSDCEKRNMAQYLVSARITQTYDSGCCIYFYFGVKMDKNDDPLRQYHELETAARQEILAAGGTLSHHHGIGKLRAEFYPRQVSSLGVELYKWTKTSLDPTNIFANGNLLPSDPVEKDPKSKL